MIDFQTITRKMWCILQDYDLFFWNKRKKCITKTKIAKNSL